MSTEYIINIIEKVVQVKLGLKMPLRVLKRSIKSQVLISVIFYFSAAFLIGFGFIWVSLMNRFYELETDKVYTDINRVREVFFSQIESLETKMGDWASWDDAYNFMLDGNKYFEKSSLADGSLLTMKVDTFIWKKKDGTIRWAKSFDHKKSISVDIKRETLDYFLKDSSKFTLALDKTQSGVLDVPGMGLSIVSIFPVWKSSGDGPSPGVMIVSRSINSDFIKRLSGLTKLNLNITDIQSSLNFDEHKIIVKDSKIISGITSFKKLNDDSGFSLSFDYARDIANGGEKLAIYTVFLFATILILLAWIIWNKMDKIIVSRLLSIFEQVKQFDNDIHKKQIQRDGEDEIGNLIDQINEFLVDNQQAHILLESERLKTIHSSKLASLGEMAAGIAHEINNPLAVIIGSAPLLRKFRNDEKKYESKIEVITKSAERIAKIVGGLRKFSRSSTSSKRKMEKLDQIIAEALILTEAKSKRHATPIRLELLNNLEIYCDLVEIEQVLVNLINNGIDAVKNSHDRWIKVKSFEESNHIVLQVIDSGSGISPDVEKKLFQPFFTTKVVGEGTGLGLSISKGILDIHKASIEVNRSFKNTCFEIRFPRVLFSGDQYVA